MWCTQPLQTTPAGIMPRTPAPVYVQMPQYPPPPQPQPQPRTGWPNLFVGVIWITGGGGFTAIIVAIVLLLINLYALCIVCSIVFGMLSLIVWAGGKILRIFRTISLDSHE